MPRGWASKDNSGVGREQDVRGGEKWFGVHGCQEVGSSRARPGGKNKRNPKKQNGKGSLRGRQNLTKMLTGWGGPLQSGYHWMAFGGRLAGKRKTDQLKLCWGTWGLLVTGFCKDRRVKS